jgi:putative ABC transport system permease protein
VGVGLTLPVSLVGQNDPLEVSFGRGDVAAMGYEDQLIEGRWLRGPGEVVAPTDLLHERGLAVGDRLTVEYDGRRAALTVVGETLRSPPGSQDGLFADWGALADLAPDRTAGSGELIFQVQLDRGVDVVAHAEAIRAADPGLDAHPNSNEDEFTPIVIGISTLLSVLLATVAALGVLNTVALNVRERRRDLGMLKSIGMTPRQVVTMVVTSMAALGVIGGLLGIPLGIGAHRLIVPLAADAANLRLPDSVLQVWHLPALALLALAGVAIAVLGAVVPARAAARLTIARVLHNE